MRVTKFEHAALTVQKSGRTLVIDPGNLTAPLDDLDDVVGIMLTHEHPDHWTPEHLERITTAFPSAPVLGPRGVALAASDFDVTEVAAGETRTVGPFELSFFGGRHNVIHSSVPVVDNVGVLVDGTLYYPGDSYAVPAHVDVEVLAAPLGAPWLKIGEAMDFVLDVAPRRAFGTHDMTLSVIGRTMHRSRLKWAVEQGGGEFVVLEPGDSIDV